MRDANRNSQFDDFTNARIALIQAKAEAYESLSKQYSCKFMDTLRDIFCSSKKEPMENAGANVHTKNNQPKL